MRALPKSSARPRRASARSSVLVSPPSAMMPRSFRSPSRNSFSLCSRAKACAAGQPLVDLQLLLREGQRRMREARIVEARRAVDAVEAGLRRGAIGLRGEFAGDVAGAHAQLQHHGRVARLGQLEALLDHAHDGRQVGARIEQPHRGLHRVGIGALLDHARALAVVLAENDHRAADRRRATTGSRARRPPRWCRRSTSR